MLPGSDVHYVDPAQNLVTPGQDLDYLYRDVSGLSVRRVECFELRVGYFLQHNCYCCEKVLHSISK